MTNSEQADRDKDHQRLTEFSDKLSELEAVLQDLRETYARPDLDPGYRAILDPLMAHDASTREAVGYLRKLTDAGLGRAPKSHKRAL